MALPISAASLTGLPMPDACASDSHVAIVVLTPVLSTVWRGAGQEVARARHLTLAQVAQLEEAWRTDPGASLAELSKPNAQDEPTPVALWCAASVLQ